MKMFEEELVHKFEEAFNLFAGELIGEGQFRRVFSSPIDPTIVIKIERQTGEFHNVKEWSNWQDLRVHRPFEKWLAPCVSISPYGTVLVQKRVEPMRDDELPRKLPFFLSDLKLANFGMLNGRVVCHDYAYIRITQKAKKRKADWT